MKNKIKDFKNYWNENFLHIEMLLSDDEIESFIRSRKTIIIAVHAAVGCVVSQGVDEYE